MTCCSRSAISSFMASQQELLFHAKPSLRRAYFFAFIYAAAVLYGRMATKLDPRLNQVWWICFGLLFAALFWAMLKRWTTSYMITNEEVQSAGGILARRLVVVPLARVTNAVANQSFLERILGIVNLQIDSAGGNAKEMIFARIIKPAGEEAARILRERRSNLATPSGV
ncbi:MAG: hypothetical protein DCC75_03900 [Proteobacteria bacterium]|nr:MAG: hypothetical protein DCC75_03900 [Pseudomonadota bacterium]